MGQPVKIVGLAERIIRLSGLEIRGWLARLEQALGRNERSAMYELLRDAVPELCGEAA